jgi:hypothetical protein
LIAKQRLQNGIRESFILKEDGKSDWCLGNRRPRKKKAAARLPHRKCSFT